MKVQLSGFATLGLAALAACSSEQSLMEPVRLSDLTYTGCKTSYSAQESRPEFYAREICRAVEYLILTIEGEVDFPCLAEQ